MVGKILPFVVCLLPLALTTCAVLAVSENNSANTNSTPDRDAIKIIAMADQARQVAQKSQGEILRQVDTDLIQ
jgi:hypothetical protein